jgi:hypothetical protein
MSDQDLEPTFSPQDGQTDIGSSSSATGGGSSTSKISSEMASASFAWRALFLYLLWTFALMLLVIIIVRIYCCRGQRPTERAPHQERPKQEQDHSDVRQSNEDSSSDVDDVENAKDDIAVNDDRTSRHTCYKKMPPVVVSIATLIAFSLSLAVHASCNVLDPIDDNANGVSSYGLWRAKIPGLFEGYDDEACYSTFRVLYFDVEPPLVVARLAAVLATVLGGIWVLLALKKVVNHCRGENNDTIDNSTSLEYITGKKLFWRFGLALALTAIIQMLPLIFMVAEFCPMASNSCDLGYGALSILTASSYWIITAIALACIPV